MGGLGVVFGGVIPEYDGGGEEKGEGGNLSWGKHRTEGF